MSEEKKKKFMPAGDMRPSQLVSGFGPGSIISMENDAVMILGCQVWPKKDDEEKKYEILNHPLLNKILNIEEIRMPFSRDKSRVIPAISFPQWSVCMNKECQILQKHNRVPDPRRKKPGYSCYYCDKNGKFGKLIHARLVVICEKGHIDEFPWAEWTHRDLPNTKCPKSDTPLLQFFALESSSGLGDYMITCKNCGAKKTLSGSTDKSKFLTMPRCSGRRPWLHENNQTCVDEKTHEPSLVRGVQIRAPSLYYSVGISAIKIPRYAHPVYDKLFDPNDESKLINTIRQARETNREYSEIIDFFNQQFQGIENAMRVQKENEGHEVSDEIIKNEIIEKLKDYFEKKEDADIPSQIQILNQEFDDISNIEDSKGKNYEKDFQLKTSDINEEEILQKYLSSLKRITRITTISALRGFTRAEPPDPLSPNLDNLQPVTTSTHLHKFKWLPGIENKGEGVFFSLENDQLKKWEKIDDVKNRCDVLIKSNARFAQPKDDKKRNELEERYNPRFILLHTLSHIIMKEMATFAGYSEASLKERIFWDNKDRNGILIYASSGTSEGSLGGLVRLGQSDEFARILNKAIKNSLTCSKDPICGETDPVRDYNDGLGEYMRLQGATCHSCSIVPETSCAFFNHFIDRRLIMDEDFGFFKELISR